MEDLSKTQIVLLCVLISFVTSIATGIITTVMVQKVPISVTQPITRVIQQTVERVQPKETVTQQAEVIVHRDEQIARVADMIRPYIAHLYQDAQFITPALFIKNDTAIIPVNSIDTELRATYNLQYNNNNFSIVQSSSTPSTQYITVSGTSTRISNELVWRDPKSLMLGETVMALGGNDVVSVHVGRITRIDMSKLKEEGVAIISTDIVQSSDYGLVLVDLSGDIVGIQSYNDEQTGTFISDTTQYKGSIVGKATSTDHMDME